MKPQVWLCGRWDEASMLESIVGWAVGSQMDVEHREGVAALEHRGHIQRRVHVAPAGTWAAYALTPAGFARLREIASDEAYDRTRRRHEWYEKHAVLIPPAREPEELDAELAAYIERAGGVLIP